MNDRRLLRHLGIAVLAKLVILAALWWVFVRDNSMKVDASIAAAHLIEVTSSGPPSALPGVRP